MGRFRDADLPRRRRLLEARRDIGRIANGRIVHAQVVANGPDDHQPGVEPHADREFDPLGLILTAIRLYRK